MELLVDLNEPRRHDDRRGPPRPEPRRRASSRGSSSSTRPDRRRRAAGRGALDASGSARCSGSTRLLVPRRAARGTAPGGQVRSTAAIALLTRHARSGSRRRRRPPGAAAFGLVGAVLGLVAAVAAARVRGRVPLARRARASAILAIASRRAPSRRPRRHRRRARSRPTADAAERAAGPARRRRRRGRARPRPRAERGGARAASPAGRPIVAAAALVAVVAASRRGRAVAPFVAVAAGRGSARWFADRRRASTRPRPSGRRCVVAAGDLGGRSRPRRRCRCAGRHRRSAVGACGRPRRGSGSRPRLVSRLRGELDGDGCGASIELGGRGDRRRGRRRIAVMAGLCPRRSAGRAAARAGSALAARRELAGDGRAWFARDGARRATRSWTTGSTGIGATRPADWPTIEVGAGPRRRARATDPATRADRRPDAVARARSPATSLADLDRAPRRPGRGGASRRSPRDPGPVVVVSDEVGLGIVPMHPGARAFRDLVGLVHQRLAAAADEVHLMVAGLPLTLKPRS